MTDIDWNLSRVFLAALDASSLSGAARALGLAQLTVGRQIAQFEAQLGVSLFTRSPRGLRPTAEALQLEPHARAMAAAAGRFARIAAGDAPPAGGAIRITASEVVGAEVLPALLSTFRFRHPRLAIELSLTNRLEDVLGGAVDIAIRMAQPTQGQLVARRLGEVRLGLHAHRDYLKAHALPTSVAELAGHALIGFDHDSPFLRRVMADMPFEREDFALRCDSDLGQLAALRAGFGIGFMQCPLAARQPELVHVLPDAVGFGLPLWLVLHEDQRHVSRVRLLFDHLAKGLADYLGSGRPAALAQPV